jgi:hypothetical protein
MPILGTVASQVPGRLSPTTGFVSIATQTVSSGGASSITFSNIPQVYKHLQIRGKARGTDPYAYAFLGITFNGDTGTNYSRHIILGDGVNSPPPSYGYTSQTKAGAGYVTGSTSGSNMFGAFVTEILDYTASNKYKTVRSLCGGDNNASATYGYINYGSTAWMNTNAITSISLFTDANIAQYSSFALYGIQGA